MPEKTNFSLKNWVNKLPIPKKLNLATLILSGMLVLALLGLSLGMYATSALSALVYGEGLWSKAQKDAVYSLTKYSMSFDEKNYAEFKEFLNIPLGDRRAREELQKEFPDEQVARQGLSEGGNHPKDISRIINAILWFKNVGYMKEAMRYWQEGDHLIESLRSRGDEIDGLISKINSGEITKNQDKVAAIVRINEIMSDVSNINTNLTFIEKSFSQTLSEASRQIGNILLNIIIGIILLLGGIAVIVVTYINKTVARVDRAKSEFVSIASHQLRTPLTTLKWYSGKLMADIGKINYEKAKEYAAELNFATEKMIDLVENILNVSRIELGKIEIVPQKIDIKQISEKVFEELSQKIKEKKLNIDKQYDEATEKMFADAKIVKIIIDNLLSNAIKYTPEGGDISLSITESYNGNNVVINVKDTGIGISKDEQVNIFSKLFRAKNAQSTGTGLGLYMTKELTEKCRGRIWFHSYENVGSSFYVILPKIFEREDIKI